MAMTDSNRPPKLLPSGRLSLRKLRLWCRVNRFLLMSFPACPVCQDPRLQVERLYLLKGSWEADSRPFNGLAVFICKDCRPDVASLSRDLEFWCRSGYGRLGYPVVY